MELTKKLNMFYASAIEVANRQSSNDLKEFTLSMDKMMEEYKKNKMDEMESRYRVEEEKLKREENRQISQAVTELKRNLNLHQQEKKKALFTEVQEKLAHFRESEDYETYLIAKIKMARKFARKEKLIVYLDPADAGKKEHLEQETGCALCVSETDFGGGIRAEVRSKNVLIDESFQTRLRQEWDAYAF